LTENKEELELAPAPSPVTAARLLQTRWIVRAPVWLYRARLGFLLGSRLLMLEHTGRKTGTRRYAVLEIVYCPQPGTYVVASGFGTPAPTGSATSAPTPRSASTPVHTGPPERQHGC